MPMQQIRKTINTDIEQRAASVVREAIDQDARTVELAFSSEAEVERWWGVEVLDHAPDSVRIDRLANGAPLLSDHNHRDHVGVVESFSFDPDRRGRAVVRFGNSARAEEKWQDVIDGIIRHVSVGYVVHEAVLDVKRENAPDVYRVTDWEPMEISLVSVPADHSVGIGRSQNATQHTILIEEKTMSGENQPAVSDQAPPVDVRAIENEARERAQREAADQIEEIRQLGADYQATDLAGQIIRKGGTADDMRRALLERQGMPVAIAAEAPDIGMSDSEARQFSFVRAINALVNPTDRRAQEAAAFEFECSAAAAERTKKEVQGLMVPVDVLKRDLTVGTATAGGHLVATDLLSGSFIDMLRNKAVLMQEGMATILTDLNGNIAIPRQTGGATSYWVAEGNAPTESNATFDQVAMSPNTVGAFSDISRKLLLQSSIDVEMFVRGDLAKSIAIALDLAGINGSGASNQPTGILNTSGIGSVVGGANGAAPDWADIIDLETEVAIDNADLGSLSYLTNAKVRGKLKKTAIETGAADRVWDTRAGNTPLNGYGAMVTNQVPSDLDKGTSTGVCSAIIFGNFADLIIGLWGGLDLTVDPYSNSTSGTVRVVGLQDADVSVRHPESFAAMQDVLTT